MHLGSGQDKYRMSGRLLQRFQKRVECGRGQHMNLVYNIDFIPSADGRILHVFHYLAYLIYAVVGCGVQLDDIYVSAAGQSVAYRAAAARRAVAGLKTVYRAGEYARARRFACSAAAGKQISMRNAIRFYLIDKRAGNMLLSYDVRKNRGTVFSV